MPDALQSGAVSLSLVGLVGSTNVARVLEAYDTARRLLGYEARKPVNLRWPRPRRHGAQKPGVPQREGSACLRGIRSLERRV